MSSLTDFLGTNPTVPCELLIIGGGGAGGNVAISSSNYSGGGGGSGELIYYTSVSIQRGVTYNWSVGAGGTSTTSTTTDGSNSFFGSTIAGGGGYGGNVTGGGTLLPASAGVQGLFPATGSGGGGSASGSGGLTGAGNVVDIAIIDPAVFGASVINLSGAGITATAFNAGAGGGALGTAGYAVSITGSSVTYAAGGPAGVAGGSAAGSAGTANRGNGGGGASGGSVTPFAGGAGGSGVIIIAYPASYGAPSVITGTYTTPTRSGYLVYSLNSGTGTFAF
jgi:hypothetical protein